MTSVEKQKQREEFKVKTRDLFEEGKVLLGCSGWKAGFYIMLVLAFLAGITIVVMYYYF
jgi:hypothetical protein